MKWRSTFVKRFATVSAVQGKSNGPVLLRHNNTAVVLHEGVEQLTVLLIVTIARQPIIIRLNSKTRLFTVDWNSKTSLFVLARSRYEVHKVNTWRRCLCLFIQLYSLSQWFKAGFQTVGLDTPGEGVAIYSKGGRQRLKIIWDFQAQFWNLGESVRFNVKCFRKTYLQPAKYFWNSSWLCRICHGLLHVLEGCKAMWVLAVTVRSFRDLQQCTELTSSWLYRNFLWLTIDVGRLLIYLSSGCHHTAR